MRKFNALVFDEYISGTSAYYTSNALNDRLGTYDKLTLFAVVDNVSGTNPTLTAHIEESADQRNWVPKNGVNSPEIAVSSINANATTTLFGGDASSTGSLGFVRIAITLGGTTPNAHVKLYVTARDDSGA